MIEVDSTCSIYLPFYSMVRRAAEHSRDESHWDRRFNGEWFELSQAEVAEFKSVAEMTLDNDLS